MCGILGVWNYRSGRPVDMPLFRQMRERITYRGPDDASDWSDGEIALGHRRLSILDLSANGRQPMVSRSGRYVIAYNGEIYNYRELRQRFLSAVPLNSETDTEVFLELFEQLGPAAIEHCNGMFAIAVWDREQNEMFVFRDRAGIKPLYYCDTAEGFKFASEIKALLGFADVPQDVSPTSILTYLHFGYVPGQDSIYRNIKKLHPGHYLHLSAKGCEEIAYWQLNYHTETDRGLKHYAEEFESLFASAVDLRLRSDVPLGIFLSGGLDSSAVVAQLSKANTQRLKTFSVSYDFGPEYDESPYARVVAKKFDTDHHEVRVTPAQFRDWIPQYIWHMDEPVTEAAAISLHYLSDYTRKHVTVVLSGEGADELLGGYDIYRYMSYLQQYRRLPAWLRHQMLEPLLRRSGISKLEKYIGLAQRDIDNAYFGVSLNDGERLAGLIHPDFLAAAGAFDLAAQMQPYRNTTASGNLNKMLAFDTRTWLVDNLLIKADKMTMASSLELRVPFLDYRMLEFAARLPEHYKVRRGTKKFLLKHCYASHLPAEIIKRKKVGFPTPLKHMFEHELRDYVGDLLTSQTFRERGIYQQKVVQQWLDDHQSGRRDNHRELWLLIVLEQWMRMFSDDSGVAPLAA